MKRIVYLILISMLLMSAGCVIETEDSEEKESSSETLSDLDALLILGFVFHSGSGYEEEEPVSECSTDINSPVEITYLAVGRVEEGSNCYYSYRLWYRTDLPLENSPRFTLEMTGGNADLYLGEKNDPTGGTIGYQSCTSNSRGGGWNLCSLNSGRTMDELDTRQVDMPVMSSGDFRLIGVRGVGHPYTDFALTVYGQAALGGDEE